MAIGNFLGGAARGLEAGFQRNTDAELQRKALAINERSLKRQEQNALIQRVNENIAGEMKVIAKIIENGRGEPTKAAAFANEMLKVIELTAEGAGLDPSTYRRQVDAMLAFPEAEDPADTKRGLEIGKLEREAAGARAQLEDTAISASAGLRALGTVEEIEGADIFLTNPGLIATTRQALSIGKLDPTGILSGLPSQVSKIPQDDLITALNAAETVNKQRNALGQGLSNQAGVAGLRARLESLGEGAGLSVQRGVFEQALELAKREAEKGGEPIDLGDFETGETKTSSFVNKEMLERALREGQLRAGDKIQVSTDVERTFAGRFATAAQFEAAAKSGRIKQGDIVIVNGQMSRVVAAGSELAVPGAQ